MSNDQAKKLAKQFIDDQRRILEAHGDGIVQSKYQDAIAGAQKTFATISTASRKLSTAQTISK